MGPSQCLTASHGRACRWGVHLWGERPTPFFLENGCSLEQVETPGREWLSCSVCFTEMWNLLSKENAGHGPAELPLRGQSPPHSRTPHTHHSFFSSSLKLPLFPLSQSLALAPASSDPSDASSLLWLPPNEKCWDSTGGSWVCSADGTPRTRLQLGSLVKIQWPVYP